MGMNSISGDVIIVVCCVVSLMYGLFHQCMNQKIHIATHGYLLGSSYSREVVPLVNPTPNDEIETKRLSKLYNLTTMGSQEYLKAQYGMCLTFTLFSTLIIFIVLTWSFGSGYESAISTAAFLIGSCLGGIIGLIAVSITLSTGIRVAISAQESGNFGYMKSFISAIRAGSVFSFSICSVSLLLLFGAFKIFHETHGDKNIRFTEIFASTALGISLVALFLRIGGGIFRNSLDIGSNLISKIIYDIPDGDIRNPACIGSLIGVTTGAVSGLRVDIIESWVEITCASLYILAIITKDSDHSVFPIYFPFLALSAGIISSLITSVIIVSVDPKYYTSDIDLNLRVQLFGTAIAMVPLLLILVYSTAPDEFLFDGIFSYRRVTLYQICSLPIVGLFGGLAFGLITEYYTSNKYWPVQNLAVSAAKGAASEIMEGVSVGQKSVLPGAIVHSIMIYIGFQTADVLGIALVSLGEMSMLPAYLILALFGPVCESAASISALSNLEKQTQEKTKALDNSGSTLSAIVKGYKISCAMFSSITMFSALLLRLNSANMHFTTYGPIACGFIVVGSALPHWITSITLSSVNKSIEKVVKSVSNQLNATQNLWDPSTDFKPDYTEPIRVAIIAFTEESVLPAVIGILSPITIGVLFGFSGLVPMIAGFILSAVMMSTSMTNTGSAWNNAKRIIQVAESQKGITDLYKATVIGDSIGDPMKDTGGPSLNILMKTVVTSSFVLVPFYIAINNGKGLLDL